ncbi:MAG: hypothetical protein U9P82_08670 [Bacteroidota bacterium]|nr:hypothetical protein [Bacteroidota bacterium]
MENNLIKIGLVIICFLFTKESFSQEYGIDKNSWMISGSFSFSKHDGELYEDIDGNKTTTVYFSNTTNYFLAKGLFAGLGISYSYRRTGADGMETYGIGPNLGYIYGKKESKLYPFVAAGFRLNNINQDSEATYVYSPQDLKLLGYNIFGSIGIIFPVKEHIGITFELDYSKYYLTESQGDYDGNILTFSVGIIGFIF